MCGEGQSAFKCQRKEKVCKDHRVQACGTPNEMGAGWFRGVAVDADRLGAGFSV